jgi:cation diffusion facilitator family transporter
VLGAVLALNLLVAVAKLGWGIFSHSAAMQADGFHSLFDGTSNVIGLIGIGLASRPPDRDHPYGHVKFETYASAAIGAMLMLAAWRVGSSALERLAGQAEPPLVDARAFAVMMGTLCVNLAVTRWRVVSDALWVLKSCSPMRVTPGRMFW